MAFVAPLSTFGAAYRVLEGPGISRGLGKCGVTMLPEPREVHYRSSDGLALFVRDYGPRLSPWLPVVCLAGLSRSGRDFDQLGKMLAGDPERPRRVLALDYRGRGRSAWDGSSDNYNPLTEMGDVFDGMAALGVPRAVVVGTSRGGIIAMLMAVA